MFVIETLPCFLTCSIPVVSLHLNYASRDLFFSQDCKQFVTELPYDMKASGREGRSLEHVVM